MIICHEIDIFGGGHLYYWLPYQIGESIFVNTAGTEPPPPGTASSSQGLSMAIKIGM